MALTRVFSNLSAVIAFAAIPLTATMQGCTSAPVDPSEGESPSASEANETKQEPSDRLVMGTNVHIMKWRDPDAPRAELSSPGPSGAHLTYYGGRVVSAMQVVQVLWGTGSYLPQVSSTATPSMASFYQQALNGSYVDWLDGDYNTVNNDFSGTKTSQHISRGSFSKQVTITVSAANAGSTVDDSNIQAELALQIQSGKLPAPTHDAAGNNNTYYAVFFPNGTTITQGGSSSCVGGGFCAYHGTVASVPGQGEVYYGVHPDMQAGSGCDTGCGDAAEPFGNYTSVASHEMTETITDCEVGLAQANGPPLAWYDQNNGEVGDICDAQQSTFAGADGETYTVQQEWSNSQGLCVTSGVATVSNDFSIKASTASKTVADGASAVDTITTAIVSGSAESVALSATGQPSGVTVTFSPASVSSGASSTVTIAASASAPAGSYTITVKGKATSGTHTTTIALTVTAATPSNFSVAATSGTLTVGEGLSGTDVIHTADTAGTAESVALTVTGEPTGVTVAFSPASVTAGASSTMTITAAATAAVGTHTITITGTGHTGTHSTTVALTVTSAPKGIVNGGFETGTFSGWAEKGASETIVTTGCHGGTHCARLGNTVATNGDSDVAQTFIAPSGKTGITFWYKMTCPSTVTDDWAVATLADVTTGVTKTLLPKVCKTGAWISVTSTVVAGNKYTLTLTNHDNDLTDPTYTLYDDVTLH